MEYKKASTIAQWWVNRMGGKEKFDNGDPEFGIRLQKGIYQLKGQGFNFKSTTASEEQKEKFRSSLTLMLLEIEDLKYIYVDYGPDDLLQDALDSAGITFNPLPIKTVLWPDSLTCRIGYCGNVQRVEV